MLRFHVLPTILSSQRKKGTDAKKEQEGDELGWGCSKKPWRTSADQ